MLFLRQTRSHFEKSAWKESTRKFQNCTLEQKFPNRSKPKTISGHFPSSGDRVPPPPPPPQLQPHFPPLWTRQVRYWGRDQLQDSLYKRLNQQEWLLASGMNRPSAMLRKTEGRKSEETRIDSRYWRWLRCRRPSRSEMPGREALLM